jgi:hypothetical protein
MRVKKALFYIFMIGTIALIFARDAWAIGVSVSVSPVRRTITIPQGGTSEIIYSATNKTERAQHIVIRPRQWQIAGENENIPLESWLTLTPSEFDLEIGETKEVVARVAIPEDAEGELSAMLAFTPVATESHALNVIFSVSLYAMIKDTEIVDCRVSDFKIEKYEKENGLMVGVTLANDGNTHLLPRAVVQIENLFGKKIKKSSFKFGKPVYAKKSENYFGVVYTILKPGIYKAWVDVKLTNVSGRIGRKVYFVMGTDNRVLYTFHKPPARKE